MSEISSGNMVIQEEMPKNYSCKYPIEVCRKPKIRGIHARIRFPRTNGIRFPIQFRSLFYVPMFRDISFY